MEVPIISEYEGVYKTSGEYVEALQNWLQRVYYHQAINAGFPLFVAASLQAGPDPSTSVPATRPAPAHHRQQPAGEGQEFLIPPMWKRLLAETLDFLLLFVIKLAVTYVAVDFFDMFDVESYSLETLRADVLSDYQLTMTMTGDILLLEAIHRAGNCVFEALCLHRGGGGVGGATPGKKIMGLRVVRCQWCVPTLDDKVLVYPAADLGLGRALIRAITKNVAITLLLPLCVTMLLYQHNRTLYDVMAGSLVVEDPPNNNNNNNNNNNVNNNNNR